MNLRRHAFTLVEIMIVVAIIGILIAIAVPGFLKARETSRRNACLENQAKIEGAVDQWLLDNNLDGGDVAVFQDAVLMRLVGPELYLRKTPVCPGGIQSYDIGPNWDVVCRYRQEGLASDVDLTPENLPKLHMDEEGLATWTAGNFHNM
ncbi:prepilin-type N-terminal cleavage/methylation domain-containing protein [bacterium]|nr:prepilin-type N-terminal cleavage/methylation domain-containing protein [bacterium]